MEHIIEDYIEDTSTYDMENNMECNAKHNIYDAVQRNTQDERESMEHIIESHLEGFR